MKSDRKTAIVVGALFISATVASLLGAFALGSVLEGPDYLLDLSDHAGRVIPAVLLYLIAASSAFATAFLLFPILPTHAEGLAAGYVVLRTFENVFYVASCVALLTMLTISQSDAIATASPAQVPLMGAALLAFQDWSVVIGTLIFFGLGALTLNYVLYRSRLVPRWLSGWGIVAAPLAFLYGLLGSSGSGQGWVPPSCSWPCRSRYKRWCSRSGSSPRASNGVRSDSRNRRQLGSLCRPDNRLVRTP